MKKLVISLYTLLLVTTSVITAADEGSNSLCVQNPHMCRGVSTKSSFTQAEDKPLYKVPAKR